MKKIMWVGFSIQMLATIIIFLLVFLNQPIPDFVMIILVGGMLTCVISSIIVSKRIVEKENKDYWLLRKRSIISVSLLTLLTIIMIVITHYLRR